MAPPSFRKLVEAALPGTIGQLAKATGFAESTLRRHLNALEKEGKAHVAKRYRTSGTSSPKWVAGPGTSAPIPAARSQADYCRKSRRRVRLSLQAEASKRQAKVADLAANAARYVDPLVSALFGRSA